MEPNETVVERLQKELDRLVPRNTTTQTVRVEGMGSMWNGIAIGVALGATLVGVGWITATQNRQDAAIQQAEAYQKAIYMLAPRFAEEIDRELDRQKEAPK
jgi:uncharacterized protein HemX